MKKSHSHNSFFRYIPLRPLISCHKKFLEYINRNKIILNKKSKKKAFLIYLNCKPLSFNIKQKKFFL